MGADQVMRNLLFVCYGNMCRSPMAAAIASKIWGKRVCVESAGTHAGVGPAAANGVKAIQESFGVDISRHKSQRVKNLDLGRFDIIVALDPDVERYLKQQCSIPAGTLISWDINDPVGQPLATYKATAQEIFTMLKSSSDRILGPNQPE